MVSKVWRELSFDSILRVFGALEGLREGLQVVHERPEGRVGRRGDALHDDFVSGDNGPDRRGLVAGLKEPLESP